MKGSRRCTAVVMALGFIGACALFGAQSGRVVQAQEDPASRALAYLQTQQQPDGSIAGPAGSYADSELFAIAAAAAGYDPNALTAASGTSVMAYLAANAAGACPTTRPGACGELIQAVVAAGGDPSAFGGQDLLTTLAAGYDPATGGYGDDEAFTQALAIQGLVAAGAPVPPAAIQFLVGAQDSDGGWDYRDIRDDPNAATDFDASDTNSTAMALMALDATGDHGCDTSALKWLATQQDADGGFPYQTGGSSDPDSTALVVQAIVATGGDPVAAGWSVGGNTPLAHLEATQDPDGGYTYPGNSGPDAFTTSQVPAALERVAFPVAFGSRQWYPSGATLGAPPSSSASSTSSTSPSSGSPAGVITPLPTSLAAVSLSTASQVQAASSGASSMVGTPMPGAATATVPAHPASASLRPSAISALGSAGGSSFALLIFALVALAAALAVGGGRWAVVARR